MKIFYMLVVLGLISCSKEVTYKVRVVNETPYQIENFEIKGAVDEPRDIAISPNNTSDDLLINYKRSNLSRFFGEPHISLFITSYSDSASTFENARGKAFEINKFNKGEVNIIAIELESSPVDPLDIFRYSLNGK